MKTTEAATRQKKYKIQPQPKKALTVGWLVGWLLTSTNS
jgi:hypothetical protein